MVVLLCLCPRGVFISYVRLLPTKQIATYIQAGAKSNEGDGVARIQCVGACQPVKRIGNAGARNVAGLAQRSNHALVWHTERLTA